MFFGVIMVFLGKVGGPRTSHIFRELGCKLGMTNLEVELYCSAEEALEGSDTHTPVYRDECGNPFYVFIWKNTAFEYRFTQHELKMLGNDYDSVFLLHEKEHKLVA